MTRTSRPDDIPMRYGSRYGSSDRADAHAHRACPVCQAAITSARARGSKPAVLEASSQFGTSSESKFLSCLRR